MFPVFLLILGISNSSLPPWRNWTLPIPERVSDLLPRISVEDKLQQLSSNSAAIPSLGIDKFNWGHEALHGIVNSYGYATVFPQPIAWGATFDAPLVRRAANMISDEARGMHNSNVSRGAYGLSAWAPNANIFRDPRWGRGHETFGECPILSSELYVEFVKGLQHGLAENTTYVKLLSTPKHYAVYNFEEMDGVSRHEFDAVVSKRDLADTYLKTFNAVVRRAKPRGIMCAYNKVNGIPACANEYMLDTVLRKEMGFDGHVVSDCGAIIDIYQNHHYASSQLNASVMALKAGNDLDCGSGFDVFKPSDVGKNKPVELEVLDRAVGRLFTNRMLLGEFDPAELNPFNKISPNVVDSKEHREAALQMASESLVLVKNDKKILPLQIGSGGGATKMLVLGPHANDTEVLLGNYHGIPSRTTTPLAALKALESTSLSVDYNIGVPIDGDGLWRLEPVMQQARNADVVVMFLGLSAKKTAGSNYDEGNVVPALEKESLDRYTLRLPGVQRDLLRGVARQTDTPIVLVLTNGGGVDVEWALDSHRVSAILESWYGGEEAGAAVAQTLLGMSAPAGRLPITMYKESFLASSDYTSMSMTAAPGRTYRYMPPDSKHILRPFGYGLSYTTMEYTNLTVVPANAPAGTARELSFDVTNKGSITSDEVVLAFISTADVPPTLFGYRKLGAFARMHSVAPGAVQHVRLAIPATAFEHVKENGVAAVTPGNYVIRVEDLVINAEVSS